MSTKIDFTNSCPVVGCENSKNKLNWRLYNCNYKETINENGIMRCKMVII